MSCGYCGIAVVMSVVTARSNPEPPATSLEGLSRADLVFGVFNALGGVAFTFGGEHLGAASCRAACRPLPSVGAR